ncbi:MAG: alkene reductase [Cyanobacteriota bacterium]
MKLLEKIKIGSLELNNRVVMAPMTRSRAHKDGLVTDSTVTYYSQRATAGLIISEAVNISEQAIGSPFTPGIYTEKQIEAWKKVTSAVHEKGGKIFIQLWHTGRVGHSSVRNGILPVAPSAIKIEGQQHFTPTGMQDYEVPRALELEEVKDIIKQYGIAAKNALTAGFDGVELHGAFGYLPNQFLVDGANKRTDEFGGSIENRCRFVLDIMNELLAVFGEERVGIKLSPSIPFNGMIDSDPKALYTYLIKELNKLPLAYLHLMLALFPLDNLPTWPKDVLGTYSDLFDKKIIANGGYNKDSAEKELLNGKIELISFGSLYVSNPDLVKRFELNIEYNEPDRNSFYGGDDKGYIDYPTLN